MSIRVSDDQKEKFGQLVEQSDLKAGDVFQSMIDAYELSKAKDLLPENQADLSELQVHTNRINAIVLNVIERNITYRVDQDMKHQGEMEQKNSMLQIFDNRLKELEGQIQQLKNEKEVAEKESKEKIRQISEMEKTSETTAALVAEYKEKNDTLAGMLSEYKQYKTDIEQVRFELSQERELRRQAESDAKDKGREIEDLKALITSIKADFEDKMKSLKEGQQLDIERIHTKAELDKEKVILEIQVEHQKEINNLHASYTTRIQELLFRKPDNEEREKTPSKGKRLVKKADNDVD